MAFSQILSSHHSPNVSTTPITAMGCQQCLPLSVVQLKVNIAQKPIAIMGLQTRSGQVSLLSGFTSKPIAQLVKVVWNNQLAKLRYIVFCPLNHRICNSHGFFTYVLTNQQLMFSMYSLNVCKFTCVTFYGSQSLFMVYDSSIVIYHTKLSK